MPKAPNRFAAPWAPKTNRAASNREHDQQRRKRHPWRNWYKLAEWSRIRKRRLADDPLCVMCLAEGKTNAATIVDHVVPHKGNRELFFSYANTQSLCETHHNRDKQRMEARGEIKSASSSNAEPDFYF